MLYLIIIICIRQDKLDRVVVVLVARMVITGLRTNRGRPSSPSSPHASPSGQYHHTTTPPHTTTPHHTTLPTYNVIIPPRNVSFVLIIMFITGVVHPVTRVHSRCTTRLSQHNKHVTDTVISSPSKTNNVHKILINIINDIQRYTTHCTITLFCKSWYGKLKFKYLYYTAKKKLVCYISTILI